MEHRLCRLTSALMLAAFAIIAGSPAHAQDMKGKQFDGVSFAEAMFDRCDFYRSSAKHTKADRLVLYDISATDATCENVSLSRPRLVNLWITGADWERGKLSGTLENIEMPGLKFERCSGRDIKLEYSSFNDLSLRRVDVRDLSIDNMEVSGGRFENLTARYSRWRSGDLSGSTLERVELSDGRLSNCDLSGARLDRCDLRNARLDNCDISGLVINGYNVEELIRKAGR